MRAFSITWNGKTWTDEHVAAAHVISVADVLGESGFDISPWSGPKQLAAWIAVLTAADRIQDLAEVTDDTVARLTAKCIAEVYSARPDALLNALRPRMLSVAPEGDAVDVSREDC